LSWTLGQGSEEKAVRTRFEGHSGGVQEAEDEAGGLIEKDKSWRKKCKGHVVEEIVEEM
jgi:hypothetical protein